MVVVVVVVIVVVVVVVNSSDKQSSSHLVSSISALGLQLGLDAADLLAQVLVVYVDLLPVGAKQSQVLGRLVLVHRVLVRLIECTAAVVRRLGLLHQACYPHTRL